MTDLTRRDLAYIYIWAEQACGSLASLRDSARGKLGFVSGQMYKQVDAIRYTLRRAGWTFESACAELDKEDA